VISPRSNTNTALLCEATQVINKHSEGFLHSAPRYRAVEVTSLVEPKLESPTLHGTGFNFKIEPELNLGIVDFGVSTNYTDQVLSPQQSLCSFSMPSPVLYESDATTGYGDQKVNAFFVKSDYSKLNEIDPKDGPLDLQGLFNEEPLADQFLTSYLEELVSNEASRQRTGAPQPAANQPSQVQQFRSPLQSPTEQAAPVQAASMPQPRNVSEYSDTLDADWVKIDEADLADLPACFADFEASFTTESAHTDSDSLATVLTSVKTEPVSSSSESTCSYDNTTPGTSRSASYSKTLSSRSKGKRSLPKDSDEYKAKRARNNVAVRRSRDKAKLRQVETEQRVRTLSEDNDKLNKKVELLTKELTVLKGLFLNVGASLPEDLQKYLQQ